MRSFKPIHERLLFALAIFGFMVPNGVFLYYSLFASEILHAAFGNPIGLIFMLEALLLMILFAWLIHHRGYRSPGWIAFIVMSLVGSMAFSVPAFLYLTSRNARTIRNTSDGFPELIGK